MSEGVGGGEALPAFSSWRQVSYTIKRVTRWHIDLATIYANVFYFVVFIILFFIYQFGKGTSNMLSLPPEELNSSVTSVVMSRTVKREREDV